MHLDELRDDANQKRKLTRKAVAAAKRAQRKSLAAKVNEAVVVDPNSAATAGLIDKAAEVDRSPQVITELCNPLTKETHSDVPGQTECLRTHHAALGQPAQARTEHVHARRKWAATKVEELADLPDEGPHQLNTRITQPEAMHALSHMKNGKASGHDGLCVELLKNSGEAGIRMLTNVFNVVLNTRKMPSQWRKGDVVSSFKTGDPTDCGNYRGITLLPVIDKLYMTILGMRIEAHVKLHEHQYGFVKRKGTAMALFNLVATMQEHALAGDPLMAFFLDVRKAFDTVNRNMLLIKLHNMGITGKVWHSVRASYASTLNRIKHGGNFSDYYEVLQGVAQGCPLSPILFIIFMNDLQETLHTVCAKHGVTIKFDEHSRPYMSARPLRTTHLVSRQAVQQTICKLL